MMITIQTQLIGQPQTHTDARGRWRSTIFTEADVAVGDIFQVGQAVVQVSAPRYTCTKQERKLKLTNFFNEVLRTQRTGFYLRVLMPGMVQVGDKLTLVERPSAQFTIQLINQNTLVTPDQALVQQMLALPTLAEGWKKILEYKLDNAQA
jgi:MOSC domain-containing protein YiiM